MAGKAEPTKIRQAGLNAVLNEWCWEKDNYGESFFPFCIFGGSGSKITVFLELVGFFLAVFRFFFVWLIDIWTALQAVFWFLGIGFPLPPLVYRRLFSDFVHPKGWWPPLVEACHCMQRAGPAAWAFPEQGNGTLSFFKGHFADLAVYSGLVVFLEGRCQDAVMPDAGKSLGQDMEGEPPEELSCFQFTGFPFSLLPVVLYREANLSVLEAPG